MKNRYLILALTATVLLLCAWAIGRVHMSFVGADEVGKLTPERLTQRLVVYGAALGALFTVLGAFPKSRGRLSPRSQPSFVAMLGVSGMFALVVLTGSYLEAFWYRSELISRADWRRRAFENTYLPMLYGSLYLYWFALIPTWLMIAANAFNRGKRS
jgi:hypothetical protein